jgi:hypothetical protein
MPEETVLVRDVKAIKTRNGNTRFVVTDDEGREFSTFKEDIARGLPGLQGKRARIRFHEQTRGQFTNVYLDEIEPLEETGGAHDETTDPDEVGWQTAVEAAPYLLSSAELEREVPPEELFERLRPFKELVAEDIEGDAEAPSEPQD